MVKTRKSDRPVCFKLAEQGCGNGTINGRVEVTSGTLAIFLDGYGTKTMEPGHGEVIYLELYEGQPRLVVWSDITQEEATHHISLAGAGERHRAEKEHEIIHDDGAVSR